MQFISPVRVVFHAVWRKAAYHVRDGKGDKGFFTRVGAAWQHKDGKGFNIAIEPAPLDGRITLRVRTEKKE